MDKEIPLEIEEQKTLVGWLRLNHIMHFAPTNENNSHKQNRHYAMIAEQKAKAAGKRKGVSDLIIMLPSKILFIELKRRKKKLKNGDFSIAHSKPSKEQYQFMTDANKFDYAEAVVCYGARDAIAFINSHRKG